MIRNSMLALALVFLFIGCNSIKADKSYIYEPTPATKFVPLVVTTPTPIPSLVSIIVPTSIPTPKVTPKPTIKPQIIKTTPKPTRNVYKVKYGTASTYGPGYAGYLALPEGPGILVEVCGPGGCIIRRSNDAGPSKAGQRAGRVVDLDVRDFEIVSGGNWTIGLVHVRVRYLRG
jgi:hypothetical protein